MSANRSSAAPHGKPGSFELKSAQLPLVSLFLKSADFKLLKQEWHAQYAETPDFFDQDPLVLDLTALADDPSAIPAFSSLLRLLRASGLCPMAVKGGNAAQMAAAVQAGLVVAQDVVLARGTGMAEPAASPPPPSAPPPAPAEEAEPTASAPAAAQTALVLDKPLRSGQQVYARGRDLVVLAMVNPGAEVIADGNIHVYAPLRGKAIAGARGDASARIFALSLEAELVSIAGIYRTSEVPFPSEVAMQPAMIHLQSGPGGDKLVMQPLKT
jgi:septum site-determining protein MinC